jgi:methyl-accepting chemotaxis protein
MAVLFGGAVLRTISRDTNELLAEMLSIENNHDLTRRLPVRGNDELARIALAVNKLLESMHQFARSVRDQSEANIGATSSLLSRAASVAESAQQQNQVAEQASEHLSEIVSSIHAISRRAAETRDLTVFSAQLGQQGSDVVTGTAAEMAKVAQQVQIAADDIRNLDKQSAEIDTIVSAISDIADQTNLLALNAAIESARAGESGRGFAVVADEVRKLAERTRHFTGEIQKTISTIRKETASAAACMESGRTIAEKGVSTAESAARMIVEIQSALESINIAVCDISQTVNSQETAADVVAGQISHIAQLCNENALNAESSRQLASQTESSSKTLAQATSAFRV